MPGYDPPVLRASAVLLVPLVLLALPALGQTVPDGFAVQTLALGLDTPVAIEFLPDGRVLFAEQLTGLVRVFREGAGVQTAPVLAVPGVAAGGERGLLGIAVDPRFPTRPYLYVHYTVATPRHIRIARFTLAGDLTGTGDVNLTADPASRYDLIDDIGDVADNHNGGTVRFAVDGLLYASLGEDGSYCRAQDTTALGGVVLRLDASKLPPGPGRAFRAQITPFDNPFVSRPDSNARLVAVLGLRNPFRIQPDRVRNWLVIGDPGEGTREELDVVALRLPTPRPALPEMGADFGWPFFEGTFGPAHGECGPVPPGLAGPAFEYDRTAQLGGAAIIAAGAYWPRPSGSYDWPAAYSGNLFANDYYSGALYRLVPSGSVWAPAPPVAGQPAPGTWGAGFTGVSDWTVGPDGAFWFCRQSIDFAANTGSIGRIVNTQPPPPPPPSSAPLSLALRVSPAIGSAILAMANATRPAVLTLHDASGRIVRTFHDGDFVTGAQGPEVHWDGRDADGRALRPGLYVAKLESAGRTATARVPFLR